MTELLAPAGTKKALEYAVKSGADAVYLGLQAFNARIKADNFTEQNIADTTAYCHDYGVKVYVTVNISVKEGEMSSVERLITSCRDASVDAFIVTDIAVIKSIKRLAPQIPVHLSTQAGVSNAYAAKFAESLGADRVVLARETSLADISAIKNATYLELEYFVQGALCVAFSGKCLISSMVNGGSGNRGRCLQPCRLEYTCNNKKGYLLSASDICMLGRLKDLEDAGVCSFKIEGRLRSPEYVGEAVSVYRCALDNGYSTKDDKNLLLQAFNRGGYIEGYLNGKDNIISTGVQGHLGLSVGRVSKVYREGSKNLAELKSSTPLKDGFGYKLIRDGHEIEGGRLVIDRMNGSKYVLNIAGAKVGDSVNVTSNTLRADYFKSIRPKARNYTFLAAKNNNLPQSITNNYVNRNGLCAVEVQNASQLSKYLLQNAIIVYYPQGLNGSYRNAVTEFYSKARAMFENAEIFLKLPPNATTQEVEIAKEVIAANAISGVYADNYYAVQLAKELNINVFVGALLNIYNNDTLLALPNVKYFMPSVELTATELKSFDSPFIFAYGYMPLMCFNHCPRKTLFNTDCSNCKDKDKLIFRDNGGYRFAIYQTKIKECYHQLYNSVVTNVTAKLNVLPYNYYVNALAMDAEHAKRVVKALLEGETVEESDFTYGHLFRGVE